LCDEEIFGGLIKLIKRSNKRKEEAKTVEIRMKKEAHQGKSERNSPITNPMVNNPPTKTTTRAFDSKVLLIIFAIAASFLALLYFASYNYFDQILGLSTSNFYYLNATTFVPLSSNKDHQVSFFNI